MFYPVKRKKKKKEKNLGCMFYTPLKACGLTDWNLILPDGHGMGTFLVHHWSLRKKRSPKNHACGLLGFKMIQFYFYQPKWNCMVFTSVQMHSWRMDKVASVGYSINNMHFSSFSFIKKNQEKKFIYKYKAKM